MFKLKFVFSFLLVSVRLFAQDSFKEVDSISYHLYNEKNWQELSQYGIASSEKGYDYYYLNVRIGIAFFELKDFEMAKIYFEKALKNNSSSIFVKEYLFWCYSDLEDISEAQKIYHSLPDSIQKRMNYQPSRIVDYIYTEGGIKISNNKDVSDNLMYGRVGINHKFSPRFNVYQQYSYMQKNAIFGEMKQNKYFLLPSINLNKKWTISASLNYSNYQRYVDTNILVSLKDRGSYFSDSGFYFVDSTIYKNYINKESYKQKAFLSQININKKIRGWLFIPHIALYQTWGNLYYQDTITTQNELTFVKQNPPHIPNVLRVTNDTLYDAYNGKVTYNQWQQGLNLSYYFNKTITLGTDINFIYNKNFTKWNIIPYIKARFSNKFSIFAYYLQKGNYVLSIFEGVQVLNSFDKIKNKFNFTGELKLFNKFVLFATYQYESKIDNYSLKDYKLNSVFIGLKLKL